MIRHFLDAKTKREYAIRVESEEFGVLTGWITPGREHATLIEVAPGIWEEQDEHRIKISE